MGSAVVESIREWSEGKQKKVRKYSLAPKQIAFERIAIVTTDVKLVLWNYFDDLKHVENHNEDNLNIFVKYCFPIVIMNIYLLTGSYFSNIKVFLRSWKFKITFQHIAPLEYLSSVATFFAAFFVVLPMVIDTLVPCNMAGQIYQYELSPPDGGWGYVVVVAVSVLMMVTFVPLAGLGLLFNDFLSDTGDATSGITLISSTYITVSFFMGIFANVLLKKYSYRNVCLIGCSINLIGAFATIFASSVEGLVFTYGILQGVGFGLLTPASFSAFNAYFHKRMTLMMTIHQTAVAVGYMVAPYACSWSMNMYGYRGTLLLLAGLSAFSFPASLALQPVEWHAKKEMRAQETKVFVDFSERRTSSGELLGGRVLSLGPINEQKSFWQSLDLHLLVDAKYLNMALGLSLSFTADVAFFPIIPSIMSEEGFTTSQVAAMISIFFTADLVARVTFSVLAAFVSLDSRLTVLVASTMSAAFRILLLLSNSYSYKLAILALMGCARCFVQTPQVLVISDAYPDQFEAAYSMVMVVNGVVTLIIGGLMSYTKAVTDSDDWVCHVLTASFLLVSISWGAELICTGRRKRNNDIVKAVQ